jgi:hypothetical protein
MSFEAAVSADRHRGFFRGGDWPGSQSTQMLCGLRRRDADEGTLTFEVAGRMVDLVKPNVNRFSGWLTGTA